MEDKKYIEPKQQSENKEIETAENKEIENLKRQLQEKDKTITDYTDHLKRLQAEFENYVKRTDKEKAEFKEFATNKLILKFLVILDEFKIALQELKKQNSAEKLYKGVELIFNNFHKLLQEEGVKEIEAKGKVVDPYKHEIVLQVESDEYPENTVVEELQIGYMLKDKVLRYAKVKICKHCEDKNNIIGG